MSFVKRHLWLAIILGVMVVLSVGAIVVLVLFQTKASARQGVLVKSQTMLRSIDSYYKDETGEALVAAATFREKKLADIENYIRTQGQWVPLMPGIMPPKLYYKDEAGKRHSVEKDQGKFFRLDDAGGRQEIDPSKVSEVQPSDVEVYTFRTLYKANSLQDLRKTLNAVVWDSARGLIDPATQSATMYVAADAFYKHPWLDAPGLPRSEDEVMLRLRESQDDLWLMDDIVAAIKRTNDTFFTLAQVPPEQQLLRYAVIKELHKIEIGAQTVGLGRGSSEGAASRYLYVEPPTGDAMAAEEKQTEAKALTLSGRASDNAKGRYRVLPFRVTVVADAGNAPELVRQITGTRSFITVLNVRYEMIPDVESQYRAYLLRSEMKTRHVVYGARPLVRMTLTCESLVFRLDKARPTVPAKKVAGQ